MKLLVHWLVNAGAVGITAYLLPGVHVTDFWTALVVAVVLGIVNAIIKPILLILTLPITLVTLGLFILVINAAMVLLVGLLVPGFTVTNFWWALAFGLVLSLVNSVLHGVIRD
jgi:putative membrane protein